MTMLALPSPAAEPRRLQQRVEEIKRAWSATGVPDTRAALATDPDLGADKSAVLDLAFAEFNLRRQNGEALDAEEFCDRFPSFRNSLRDLLNFNACIDQLGFILDLPDWPEPGARVGRFTLRRELGRGAFARVYLADETTAGDRPVVVKLLQEATAEPHTLGPLSHPGIVQVLSAEPEVGADGFARIVMPFLGCATLHDLLDCAYPRADSRPPPRADVILRATRSRARPDDPPLDDAPADPVLAGGSYVQGVRFLARRLAEALAHVHAHGVVHRDLKPSNVLLGPGGRPLLLDFNLCAADHVPSHRVGGTVPYMAPEQLRGLLPKPTGEKPDGLADLYALGVILYELLTGRHPFGPMPRTPAADWLLRRQRAGWAPVRSLNPQVDPGFADLVERCLAFDPARRPAGAAQVLEELTRQEVAARRKRRRVGITRGLVLAGALLGAAIAMQPDPHEQARAAYDAHLNGAQSAFTAGDYLTAIEHLKTLLREDQNKEDPRLWLSIGRARLKQAEATPDGVKARILLFAEARSDLIRARDLFQADGNMTAAAQAQASAAYAAALDHDNPNAIGLFNDLIQRGHGSAALYNNRAVCTSKLTDSSLAAVFRDFDDALRLDPRLQAAWRNRARVALTKVGMKSGFKPPQLARAIDDIETAIKLGPVFHDVYRDAALLYLKAAEDHQRRGDAVRLAASFQQSVAMARRALEEGENPSFLDQIRLVSPLFKSHPEYAAEYAALRRIVGKNPRGVAPSLVDPLDHRMK